MGKRRADGGSKKGNKKYKVSGFIDTSSSGVYATCARGKEQGCIKELVNLFTEKAEVYYEQDLLKEDEEGEEDEQQEELSIEEQIKREVAELKETKSKTKLFIPIELGCECLIFIKTRKPVDPESFVKRICEESQESRKKSTRFTQKLTPITYSVSPSLEELRKLCARVLAPHFHQKDQKPLKFAINVTRRNFNALEKSDIIRTVAECVGRDHGHSVDLKKYDKLILIEAYKTNIGMSVVDGYDDLCKFNLQQIYERATENRKEFSTRVTNDQEKDQEKDQESDPKEHVTVNEA